METETDLLKKSLSQYEKHWHSENITQKQTKKILLIEDTPLIQKATQLLLKALNCRVTVASNGKAALQYINAKKSFDLIFMDIQLPDINGITLTKNFRQQFVQTPIIALTSEPNTIKMSCFAAGMNDFIQKPINYKTLQRALQQWT